MLIREGEMNRNVVKKFLLLPIGLILFATMNHKHKEVKMQAYCMKCRKKVEIKNPRVITMKNKRPATQGVCPVCGIMVFHIGK